MNSMNFVEPTNSFTELPKQTPNETFTSFIVVPIALTPQHHPIAIGLIRHKLKQLASYQSLQHQTMVCRRRKGR
jgi:hypothetical protein